MAALKQKAAANEALADLRRGDRENSADVLLYSVYRYLSCKPGNDGWFGSSAFKA